MSAKKPNIVERYSADVRLRRAGFRIHSRRKDAEPEWRRGGRVYPQGKALRIADAERECRGR